MGREVGLPENWRERIAGKKVILYITSVASMLNGGMKHIEKIEQVIETFRQQDGVVLWWRPHPLELSTIESMRPELKEKYVAIRTQYEKETWGVLDTSADLHRAIAISDAYYGDWSSVIQLYRVTGKPVLLANDKVKEVDEELIYVVEDFCIVENDMWFISRVTNLIYKMDLDTFEIAECVEVAEENNFEQYLFCGILHEGNKIIILPRRSDFIVNYDFGTRELSYVKIGSQGKQDKFKAYYQQNEMVYLFPYCENRVIKYDIEKEEIIGIVEIDFEQQNGELLFDKDTEKCGKYIYGVKNNSNIIYKYNLENDECQRIELGQGRTYCGIKKAGDYFVLIQNNSDEVVLWNEQTGNELSLKIEQIKKNAFMFCNIVTEGIYAYIYPRYADKLLKVALDDSPYISCESNYDDYDFKRGMIYSCAKKYEHEVWAFEHCTNQWKISDTRNNTKKSRKIIVSSRMEEKIRNRSLFTKKNLPDRDGFYEQENDNFCALSDYIANVNAMDGENGSADISMVGKHIHNYMMKL